MEPRNDIEALRTRAAARPLVRIMGALLLAACGSRAPVVVPAPTPHVVDTAQPPVLRQQRELVLLGTTDVHNRVWPYDYYTRSEVGYGLARLKPLIDSVRAANAGRTYLFDSGDILQGNPLGYVFARLYPDEPNPMMRAMNLLAYDASTIGNHEYNYGLANLNKAIREAKFPFVTANIFKHGTQEHAYRPYVLIPHVVANGDTILIGVTGNTPPGVAVWDRGNVEGILDFRDVVESVRPVVKEMKQQGADAVIVLSHGGLSGTSYDTAATGLPPENESARLAREVPDIDVIFMGHTHVEVRDTNINGVLLTQAKNWAQSLSDVTLRLERRAPSDWIVIDKNAVILRPAANRADTAFLDSMRSQHERTVAYVKSVAGTSTMRVDASEARVKDTPIIDFINEVQRKVAGADLSAAAAFDINAVIPKGDVTISDIAGLYIYDNTLKAIRITGAQLRAYLEKSAEYFTPGAKIPGYNFDIVSGVDYVIDVSRPAGSRITRLLYKGRPVRDDQSFTMALNNYRQSGGGGFGMIAGAPVVYDRQQDIKDLLIQEIQQKRVFNPLNYFKTSWHIEPAAARDSLLRAERRELRNAPAAAALADTVSAGTGEAALGNLIADAIRSAAHTQLAFIDNRTIGLRSIPAGPVTREQLRALVPSAKVIRLTVTGAQIRKVVEAALRSGTPDVHVSGMTVTYNPNLAPGARVLHMTLPQGAQIDDRGTYSVSVPDGFRMIGRFLKRERLDVLNLDALISYLQGLPQPVRINRGERRFLLTPTY